MGLGKKFIQDPDLRNIRNTFLPLCERKVLSINDLIELLRWGFAKQEKLSKDVKKLVFDELHRRSRPYAQVKKENGGTQ